MRDLTTAMVAEADAPYKCPIILVSITFASETVHLWSGVGTLTWNGQQWKGTGELGTVSNVTETAGVQADGISLSLSGISNDILADSLTEVRVGRPAVVYFGFLDVNNQVVADPYCLYRGMVDEPKTRCGTENSTITIKVENRLNDMGRNSSLRLDSETQRRKYPGDAGMDFIPQLVDSAWAWK